MVSASDRAELNRIIATCDELRDVALQINQTMLAHLLEMVVLQARQARAGDGAVDGVSDGEH